MTCVTAAFAETPAFDGRVFTLHDCRRIIFGVVIGLGAMAAACIMAAFVTVAAAWIVAASLSANPYIHARASIGPETIALNYHYPTLASAANVSVSASALTDRERAPDALLEAKLTPVAPPSSTPANAAPLLTKRPPEHANDVPSPPHRSSPPHILTRHEIADVDDSTVDAGLSPPVAPRSAPASSAPVPPARASEPAKRPQVTPQVAATPAPRLASTPQKPLPFLPAHNDWNSRPGPDSRTAVYDIEAHTVYLPDGNKLEAHSGLGRRLDDPRYVGEKNRGPTPPNVYDLVLRNEPFHGVRAIRLNPVSEGNMFGRDGMLAHTYMLGPTGQSFGCVSFRDYPAFLQAFLEGEVDRLVVVPHLAAAVSRATPSRHRDASNRG
jgi:hypothetical protein